MGLTRQRVLELVALLLTAILVLIVVAFLEASRANAGVPVKVKLTVTRVVQLGCDEDVTEACPNDPYPKFSIDGQALVDGKDDFCCAHGDEFTPNWPFEVTVDSDHNPVAIHLELHDQDTGSGDDQIDISNGGDSLDVTFDLNSCTIAGAGLTAAQGGGVPNLLQAQSEGTGDDSARVYFTVTTPHCIDQANTADNDGDGLANAWELPGVGIDGNNDGTPDLALNTDPLHKDLFVEVDWMECGPGLPVCVVANHSHSPQGDVLNDVTAAFANAPVGNPNGHDGITLHLQLDEAVRDVPGIRFDSTGPGSSDDFDDIKLGNPAGPCTGSFGTAVQRSALNCGAIIAAKKLSYRYAIFGDSYSENPESSGIAELIDPDTGAAVGGNDFMVTLGSSFGSTTASGGQRVAEASTFMHEFGHTLRLQHGGGQPFNCKPNYLSIMNYTLQFPTIDTGRPMDFSNSALGPLTEMAPPGLNEGAGIGGPAGRLAIYGLNGNQMKAAANGGIDWNGVNGGSETGIAADVNFINSIGDPGKGCNFKSPGQTLDGYDDWENLLYNFRDSSLSADGAHGPSVPELTAQQVLLMKDPPPDLAVDKSVDKTSAVGGDTLTYTVTTTNVYVPKAFNVSVTDTLPDGTAVTRSLPDLDQGASNVQSFTYVVPCSSTDSAVLTNSGTVTGKNSLGYDDANTANNTAQATTTIQRPILTLSKTATGTVNAGEAITYTITYANTGTGGASNVTVTDTLPASVYYSLALDLGAGPKPNSVTLNGNGTRTLVWNVGNVSAQSGNQTIVFTARPTLLALAGTTYTNNVSVSYKNAGGACTFAPVTASASTTITVVPPTRNPLSQGFWKTHPELWTAEFLARIQATDERYDTNQNGALSVAEATAAFKTSSAPKTVLSVQLLGTYFNLASRRLNAGTAISSTTAKSLGLSNVRDAALYAQATMALPLNSTTSSRYSSIIGVLNDINANKIEVY